MYAWPILNVVSIQTGENLMTILSTEGSSDVIIVTSQFKRANQTGEIIRKVLECPQPLLIDGALNERGFGSYDLQDSKYIVETRINDVHDVAKNTQHGIEHVTVVLSRMSSLVNQLEQTYTNKTIILVSHGDPIRILLAGFANINPSQYASIRRLDNGEIRRLTDPVVLEN